MRPDKPALCCVLYNKKNIPWKDRATQQVHAPAIIFYIRWHDVVSFQIAGLTTTIVSKYIKHLKELQLQ
jgi:hypothetical protein